MIKYLIENYEEMYRFFKYIAGSHNGIINNKIYQIAPSNDDVSYYAMTADFPNYGRILGYPFDTTYHLSGYGCTREEALIRLIGESVERYSVVYAYEFLKDLIIYSSYNELFTQGKKVMNLKYLNVYDSKNNQYITQISDDTIIGWVCLFDIHGDGEIYIPAQIFFLSYFNSDKIIKESRAFFSVSTGTATHTSYEKSLENALIEYLQIDSFMLSWYAKNVRIPELILDDEFKKFIRNKKLISDEHELLVLDMTLDKPYSVFGVFILGKRYPYVSFGVQGGIDPYHTLYRAILEAATILQYNYSSYVYDREKYQLGHNVENNFLDLDSNVVFWASERDLKGKINFLKSRIEGKVRLDEIKKPNKSALELSLEYCKNKGYSVGCMDITCSELGMNGWYTTRCIIPELLPMCLPGIPFEKHPRMKEYGGCTYEYPHPLP